MYAFYTNKSNVKKIENNIIYLKNKKSHFEYHYWRKHPALHGWMQNKFFSLIDNEKKINDGLLEFNGVNFHLTKETIEEFQQDLKKLNLPWDTSGFFFGNDNIQDLDFNGSRIKDTILDDLKFIKKSLSIIRKGKIIFYDSSW